MVKNVSTGYVPRPLQLVLHRSFKRFNVVMCHRRFGKTHLALNEILDQGFRNTKKNPQYAYLAPTYGQAKRVAWDLLKEYVRDIPNVTINEADLRIDIARPATKDRIRIQLLGAENPGSLKGIYLDGVVLDEYAEMNPQVWSESIRPALSDRLGWAVFIGTPKGQNHFYELFQRALGNDDWFTAIYKASDTGIIPVAELEAARQEMSENEYAQEFECSFTAALVGAYYGKEMEAAENSGRVSSVPYDPSLPVITGWDLGIDDTTAIWFVQQYGREIRVIDYLEANGAGLDFYVKELSNKPYNYGEHLLPHDVAVRELTTGVSRLESLKKMGLKRVRVVPRLAVEDGINASRLMIAKCVFDKTRCLNGINALKNYERKWDAKNKVFQQRPLHNWASHGSDGFRTLAVGLREDSIDSESSRKRLPRNHNSDYKLV